MAEQTIDIGSVRTRWVRIVIDQVHLSVSDPEDTAFSELRFEAAQ
jgi:hypothetical protein